MRALIVIAIISSGTVASADERERPFGVAITVSGGLAWVDMGQFSRGAEGYFVQLEQQVANFERTGSSVSHLGLTIGVRSQVRLPRFMTAETGFEVLRHRHTTPIAIGTADGEIGFRNTSLALPFALGAHVPVARGVAVFASAGPVLLLSSSSRWEYSLGQISSFVGDVGGGFEATAGVEIAVLWRVRAVAHLRYRFVKSGLLRADGAELPPLQPVAELGWKGLGGELGARLVF